MSGTPELDYFMNDERSDVLFVVEGQTIPALKALLSVKSRVFHAMFSGEFKELKDKEIVIEDTTYEAFKTFIQFLYCDDLVLKYNDFELIRELYRLCYRFDVSRLERKITDELYDIMNSNYELFYGFECESDEDFQKKWPTIGSIAKIAFEFKIIQKWFGVKSLEDKVMEFIDSNFNHFLKKDNKELSELNDLTDGRLFDLMANMCRNGKNITEELNALKKSLNNE